MATQDHETVIVDRDRGGSMGGIIAGILLAVVVVLGLVWFFNGNTGAGGTVDVDVPAVSVDVQPDGQ